MDTNTTIGNAQKEMRSAYHGGAPGVFTSAMVWMVAGVVALRRSPQDAVIALFVGGMLIHPISLLVCKALGRSAKHSVGNPFGTLALASTAWLILSLPLAYVVSLHRIEWFFPAMLFVIGGRYLTFQTMFGLRAYLALGAMLTVCGFVLVKLGATPTTGAFAGAAIECAFAIAIFLPARSEGLA
jgi:hypothetical protein